MEGALESMPVGGIESGSEFPIVLPYQFGVLTDNESEL
jgi:hypothetical protein